MGKPPFLPRPALECLAYLTIRSPKASEILRGITEEQAQQLLDSIPAGNPHQVAANLLGLDPDDDLCASVIQAARRVQDHCKPQ